MAAMNHTNPKPGTTLSGDDIHACLRVLRAIEADRSHLAGLALEQRRELLMLAGLGKKRAGLRVQRRSKIYAPLWLERPKPDAAQDRPEFHQERNCYVCKKPFAKMH